MQKQTVKNPLHIVCALLCACINFSVWALPVGGHVNGGSAVLTADDNSLLIQQSSQQLSLEFDQFNIGTNEKVTFLQPNRDAVALNRIVGGNASELLGQLESNGQVFLINPNGILFGRNSQLNVGGLMATTLNITDDDFFNGRWSFTATQGINGSDVSIQNLGNITALDNGYIALVAPNILNEGDLNSPDGSVALHSANAVVMSFEGQQLLNIETDQASLNAAIKNSGSIYADGGQVLLTAAATNGLLKTVIDNSGIISAQRIEQSGGRIFLSAGSDTNQGDILNTGMIFGSQQTEGDGGIIEIIGGKIAQLGVINVNGQGSGGGGDINVHALDSIVIANDSHTFANGGGNGDGGMIRYFTFGQAAFYNGSVMEAKGGIDSGDGGFIEVSGVQQVLIDGLANTSAANGDTGLFYIDPTDIDIIAGGGNVNGAFNTGGGFSDWLPDTVGSSDIGTDLITTLLASNNVTIDTAAANTGADTGTLGVSTDIDLNGGNGQTLTLRSNNLMTISNDICDMGGGVTCLASPDDAVNLVFDTKTNASNGHISIGGIEINSGGGDITFTSDAGLTLGAGGTFNSLGGNISATTDTSVVLGGSANLTAAGGTISLTSSLQSITLAANSALTTTSGAITLSANQAVTMVDTSSINSGSASLIVQSTVGDSDVANLTSTSTSNSAVIVTAGGSINDIDDAQPGPDISAVNGGILLVANTGINDSGGQSMEVETQKIDVTNNTSGNVIIDSVNGTEYTDVDISGSFTAVSDEAGSDILLSGFTSTSGIIFVRANDNITISDGVVLNSGGSEITLLANNGNATVTGLLTTKSAATNVVTVTAGGSILDGGDSNIDISAVNGDVNLTAGTGIVDLEITTPEGNFTNTVSGDISINQTGDIEIQTINAVAGFDLTSTAAIELASGALTAVQALDLDASTNLIIPNAGIDIGSGASQLMNLRANNDIYNTDLSRTLSLTANGLSVASAFLSGSSIINSDVSLLNIVHSGTSSLTVNDADSVLVGLISMANGTVNINTAGAGDLTLNLVGGSLTGTGGSINLNAANDLNINANLDGSAGSTNISLNASTGSLNIASGMSVDSGGGNINLSANSIGEEINVSGSASVDSASGKIILSADRVLVHDITSTNADDDAISITSNTDIQDNGNGTDVSALNGGVVLVAKTGIHDTTGTFNLDVNAAKINATNSVSGAINLDVKNGTELVDINSVGDFILLTNSGANDVVIDNITAIGGAIDVTVGGTLTIPNAGLISSSTLTLNAVDIVDSVGAISLGGTVAHITLGDIAAGKQISSSFDNLSLTSTGTNTISINDSNAIILDDINSSDKITVTSSAGAGGITINGFTTSGDLTLTANAGVSISDGVLVDVGSSNINITAFNGDAAITGLKTASSSATAIIVDANDSITDAGASNVDMSAVNGGIQLISKNGVNDIETQASSLHVTNSISGNIVINESGDISITQMSNAGDITINAGGNLSLDSNIDLNGMNNSTLTLNASGDLTLNANICEGGAACSSVDDIVILDIDAAGDITTIGGITVNSGGGNVMLDAAGSMALSQGDIVNSGLGQINVTGDAVIITGLQSTASGNAITVTSATSILERSGNDATAINGVVTLNAASGIRGGGITADVDVVAQEISVTNTISGEVRLGGGSNDMTLSNVNVSGLFLVNTTTGHITLQETALVAANDITFNSTGGSIILPNSIALPGRLTLLGAQMVNADHVLAFTAQELLLKTSGDQELVINVNNTIVDVSMLGTGDLQINSSNILTVADLDADGSAVNVNNGNVLLNTLAGNLHINANVSASDTTANGIRSGMIELSVTEGDLFVGTLNPVAITSTNNVDQNENGGLSDDSDSQVSIYAHLNGQDNGNHTITLGDSNGTDITVLAIGGDITLDAVNGVSFVEGDNRNILINSDATLTSYNQVGDEQTGIIISEGIVNNGLIQAHLNRQISVMANGISLSLDEIKEIKDTVANEVQDNKPTENENTTSTEQVGTDVDVAFSAVFDKCSVSSNEEEGDCGAQLAIKKFLGSLLIGGKLPSL